MISLCSKYVKNCNIFGQILNIWVKLILKKKFQFFFQCLALPKDPQSFSSQNLRCPFWETWETVNLWLTYAANTIAISTGPWWGPPSIWTLFSTITSTIKSITSAYWIWKPHYSEKIYWKKRKIIIATILSNYTMFLFEVLRIFPSFSTFVWWS